MPCIKKIIIIVLMLSTSLFLHAEENQSENTKQQYQKELEQASINVDKALQKGPTTIQFNELATLNIPKEFGFVPATQTKELLKLFGHNGLDGILGMITANPDNDQDSQWMVLISYVDSGHIMDDDAKEWKSDELLESLRKGTEQNNVTRKERGFPELNILGWIEKPHYDMQTNRLLWSIKALQQGASLDKASVNYNTLTLSKEGYISMNLVTKLSLIDQDKVIPKTLLASLHFSEGSRYSDFNEKTDKIAEYGLAALITGIAAKKLGFFALAVAALLKFSKVIIAALVGFGYFFTKRKKAASKIKENEENKEA